MSGRRQVRLLPARLSTTRDPPIHDAQAQQDPDDNPPGPARGGGVFLREVVLAMGAALRVLVDGPATVRAGDGVVPVVAGVLAPAPLLLVHGTPSHVSAGVGGK